MEKISYLDNLKIFLIALVVAHHAALSYQLGAANWLIPDPEKTKWISLLITSNATFFMGLFFLISAYFLPGSYERTGTWDLFKKKVVRLGIPTLFTILFILPPAYYLSYDSSSHLVKLSFWDFYREWFFTDAHFTFGHTWFILQLLLFSTIYMVCRKVFSTFFRSTQPTTLSHTKIILFTLALFVSTWLVSLKYPQDNWTLHHLFEPYHLPQYIFLFCIGILAFENKWLETLDRRIGYTWLAIGILCVVYLGLHLMTNALFFPPLFKIFWGSLMCSAWCVGLLTLFRDCINGTNSFQRYLAGNAYAVYLVHVLVVVYIQWMLLPYDHLSIMDKFLITFIVGYIVSNLLCGLARKIAIIRRII